MMETMMAKRATYYSDPVARIIDLDDNELSESWSGRVGFLIGAAHLAADESCPALTVDEWCALADADRGTEHNYAHGPEEVVNGMQHNLFDFADEGDEKWNVDCVALARRLRSASFAERLAVYEIVRRFHKTKPLKGESYADRFRRIGARLADSH